MKLEEMKAYLAGHGVEEGSVYTIGGLGGGDVDGIEYIDGVWYTYYSERGSKLGYRRWESEEDAVTYIRNQAEETAKAYGMWKDADA